MAAEVPVCDVLCEAVEYLSKLGANLRTRSENLKGKKIRKDKLRNAHAVQRAANKLLLICELSKKSLNNVENGVKKIINIVTASQSQSNSDVKPSTSKSNVKYKFFEFEKFKLRISKSVPINHFLSAKVSAKRMPTSVLEKYPVYCDCKLYRMRQLKNGKEEQNDNKSDCSDDVEVNKSLSELLSNDKKKEFRECGKKALVPDLLGSNAIGTNINMSSSSNKDDHNQSDCNMNEYSSKGGVEEDNIKEIRKPNEESNTDNQLTSNTNISNENNNVNKEKVVTDNVDESSGNKGKSLKKSLKSIAKSNDSAKKYKRVSFLDEDSSNSEDKVNNVDESSTHEDIVKSKPATVDEDDEVIILSPDDVAENFLNKNVDPDAESSKPVIKCVNINQLLKPDVAKKINKNEPKNAKQKNELKDSRKNMKPTHSSNDVDVALVKRDNEEYWAQKRKEVKAFKPKSLTINITRLPKLTKEYLLANNIQIITQCGKILLDCNLEECLPPKSKSRKICQHAMPSSKQESKNNKNIHEAMIIKNALLNESDSENDVSQKSNNSKPKESKEKCVDSLNSNTDKDLNDIESFVSTDTPHKNTGNERGRELRTPERSENNDEIKSALLNDSSEDVTPTSKKKRQSDAKSPRSQSLHAKKMLLFYSSTSESEDDDLKNALITIKDELLKVGSSDEDTAKNEEEDMAKNEDKDKAENETENGPSKEHKSSSKSSSSENNNHTSDDKESGKETSSSANEPKMKRKKIARSKAKFRRKSNSLSKSKDANDINGLTNLRTLTKRRRTRRRASTSSESSEEIPKRTTRNRIKMEKKAPRISKEDFLEAHSESDAASDAENEAEDEELPSVPVAGINGDSIGHLAKDDLLDESDSSASNEEKSDEKETEDSKKPTSDEDSSTVKSKRRKANAISSDSEAGSSRKKDKGVKMSDFEDSEDESSEAVKANSKRKKKTEETSDVSESGSDDGSKKKRRRIKQVDESDMSDSDDGEAEGRNKHGRKNIRKVMGKNQLEEATKKAAREEKERIARISERQKMYNNLDFDETGKPDEVVLEKVILDFDPETKEPLIQVDRGLVKKLKPHQANGIKFMWDACFESVKRIKKDRGSGCILAHCMGLGKTLQVISLAHTLLTHSQLTGVQRVLVVCPLSTVLNWVNEIKMWLKHTEGSRDVDVYELSRFKQNSERSFQLQQWFDHGGVCVLGYEMFRNLSADNTKKYKKKMLKSFQQSLVDPGPDLVVCDEGHLLKNEKTSLSQSMNRVRTRRRIVLTGTPLQNNLKEYYCMVQFVKPNLLGKYNEYLNRFVNPITNGQYTDSTEHDIKIMKRRSHVLHKMLDGAVQRRDYGVLAPFLPPKHEYVLFITLSEVQIKFYQFYLDNFSRRPLPGKSSGFLFPDFQSLQRIWTHPLVLKYNSERYEIMQQKKREREEEEDSEGSLVDFIDDDSTPDESSTDDSSDDVSDASDDSRKKSKKKKTPKKSKAKDGKLSTRRGTRANPVELDDADVEEVVEVKNENPTEWWIKLVTDDDLEDMRNSHKLVLLFDILRQCEAIGDKLLVFSQSLYSLDLIEHFLGKVDEATQEGRIDEKLGGHVGSWSPGVDYFRLDGSTSCENRSIWCKNFNREDNPRARLFLISTRAGGLGINLVAANRVVIFDVSWNPSHDVQSIFRVYRFGQKKPCYVYRFLAMGTMEEKIYERQVTKQAISKRVIDEQQIDRHYKENDLAELYQFEPAPPEPRPIPPLPKDRLFAEMLREHDKEIYKYHEHDSLLENKEEETLSEEERKAAWEDFENEKNRPPPAPFTSPWPMNGMAPGLFVQQQQQLAYAAIAAMLRKDMPNISDNQIRDMLPLIYNSNPALMQKMSEIYKYAAATQPPMMNPAMMNSVMNTGVGVGGGSGSGLQYEPPWQRQQQQMLQQMLQQQQQHNQMGAKYYAGGLGSRDPVAMALQQQHARQLLEPRAAGARPRGRPPAARAPQDVVNLDSD